MKAATAVLIVIGAASWSAPGSAQATLGAELGVAKIETAFWVCHRAATINRIGSSPAFTCASLTEALRQPKFGCDFNAMLAWWQQHQEPEHLDFTYARGTSPPCLAQTTP